VVACVVRMQKLAWCVLKIITFSTSLVWKINPMNISNIPPNIESVHLTV